MGKWRLAGIASNFTVGTVAVFGGLYTLVTDSPLGILLFLTYFLIWLGFCWITMGIETLMDYFIKEMKK